MFFMADTNILLRFISPSDPNHILVRDAIYSLLQKEKKSVTHHKFWENFGTYVRDLQRHGAVLAYQLRRQTRGRK